MIPNRICLAAAALALGLTPALRAHDGPHGAVTVEFVAAEKFTDIKDRRTLAAKPADNPHLHSLERHLQTRATRYLTDGQSLTFRFSDIDLAGDFEPQIDPSLHDVRMVTRLYPPRMKFAYELRDAAGAVLRSGDADLRDLAFDISTGGNTADALRYEKRMLDKWMRKEFGSAHESL